jgi:hypothetical protein
LETEESQTEKEDILKENKGKENIRSVILLSTHTKQVLKYNGNCLFLMHTGSKSRGRLHGVVKIIWHGTPYWTLLHFY